MGAGRDCGRRARRRRAVATVVLLVLAGCTGEPDRPSPDPRPADAPLQLSVAGGSRLAGAERSRFQSEVGDLLSAYVVGAFLGDYPRDDFVGALDSVTSELAGEAGQDINTLTGARFGPRTTDVVARRLVARVTPFAPEGRPVGATARVGFVFDVQSADGPARRTRLRGRLLLTKSGEGWRIFGYDVSRDDVPARAGTS